MSLNKSGGIGSLDKSIDMTLSALTTTGDITLGGDLVPDADGTRSLGTSAKEFKDLRVDGDAYIDNLKENMTVTASVTIDGVDIDTHATRHQNAGADEIAVGGLSGTLADAQPPQAHDLGGARHNADTLAHLNTKISDGDVFAVVPVLAGSRSLGTGTTYLAFFGSEYRVTTETQVHMLFKNSVTVKNLSVYFTVAPGSGKSRTITLRKNGVDQALTVTVSDANQTGSDTSNTVSFSAGDRVTWKSTSSGTPGDSGVAIFAEVVP